jgi:hypothetical protein
MLNLGYMQGRPAVNRSMLSYLTGVAVAALFFAAIAGSASARALSTSSQTFRATWRNLEATNSFGFGAIRCALTLEGSFHARTISKVINSLVGAITRAETAACTGGEAIPRRETLPWHTQYGGFAGTLPNITSLTTVMSRIRFRAIFPGLCDAEYGSATDAIRGTINREAGGGLTTVTPSSDRTTLIRTTSGFCPERLGFAGTSTSLTALNSAARLTVTLI